MASTDKGRSPSSPKKLPLSVILALTPANLDAFLTHLHRCLQTPAGIDTVLLFVGYSSHLTASLIESLASSPLRQHVLRILAVAPQLASKLGAAPTPSVQGTVESLRAISALLTEARTFMRLWGLLGMYTGAKRLIAREMALRRDPSAAAAGHNNVDRVVAWTQLALGVTFQALENAAYLAQKKVLHLSPATQMKAIVWSTRFWAASVGVELGKLLVEKVRRENAARATGEDEKAVAAWREQWNSAFLRNLAWAPLTVHWSLEKGLLNEMMIGALATIPGVISMSKLWKETA